MDIFDLDPHDLDLGPFSSDSMLKIGIFTFFTLVTLTSEPLQDMVMINLCAKNWGHRSNGLAMSQRSQPDKYRGPILSPLPLMQEVMTTCHQILIVPKF